MAFLTPVSAFASNGESGDSGLSMTLLFIAIVLIAAKISSLVERFGQPSVLGELVIGVILGNIGLLGFHFFDEIKTDEIIIFLAELGVVLLLFQIGLESNIQKMKKVGLRAFLVACVGVVAPFLLGTFIVGPWLIKDGSFNSYLFLGATLTATSVGITARVFSDLKKLQTNEAQIVLGAAVIDDVLGLIILAVVSALVTVGSVSLGMIAWITAKAILFLVGAIVLGQFMAHPISKTFAKIHTGVGMKITLALSFCLIFAFLAQLIGLAPIVGAFAAGLILDPVHFKYFKDPHIIDDLKTEFKDHNPEIKEHIAKIIQPHADRHVEELVAPIGHLMVPIFFVMTGMNVKLDTLFNTSILLIALAITVAAFIGKIISGLAAGKVNKWVVGFGMIPRGEVGLIFAMAGKTLNVVSDEIFSAIVIMVIATTLLTPPILTVLLKKKSGALVAGN